MNQVMILGAGQMMFFCPWHQLSSLAARGGMNLRAKND
jgi:hypothetical protein